jgi:hypothetical protein
MPEGYKGGAAKPREAAKIRQATAIRDKGRNE